MDGKGPLFIRVGDLIRYRTTDLLAWLSERTEGGVSAEEETLP